MESRSTFLPNAVSLLSLMLGIAVAALGLESFLLPNRFIDGGITGISMLASTLTGIPLSFLLVAVNLPFIALAYRSIGKWFAVKSAMTIVALALVLATFHFPVATDDKLLASVFGGFFIGAGVGLAMRGGGVLDGTEILAVVLSLRTFATVGEIVLVLNTLIFLGAAALLGVEPALYSMLTYFTASKTIDYLLHGIEAYNGLMIITRKPREVRQAILREMRRGVTAFKARGGYSDVDNEVLFCVVTRLEISRLENLLNTIDDSAFVVTLPVLDTKGGTVKQRPFH